MEDKKPEHRFKKGESGNPKGRPKGTGGPVSRLRSTLNKLKGLEPDAIDLISKVIDGEDVDKSQLDTAKWVVSMIGTLTRGAIAEESFKTDQLERKAQDIDQKANGTTGGNVKRFSLPSDFGDEEE